ncbi:MAG: PSD1 and planctomycete cytochrome C domain-containing protein [Planctomycetales bacterium]|nr:PSD1 and planctomycete cytochrome C domain-containing protein [Planctomycetales bacterium]
MSTPFQRYPFPAELLTRICVASVLLLGTAPFGMAADFVRDVQPILSEHCTQCHGADEKERKSGLRLDQRDGALKGGESGTAAIVPGKIDQGELIRRITSADPDEMMPPPDHKKPLSPAQIATLKDWIKEGANYQAHWAFTAPVQSPVPAVGEAKPLDAFVVARLKERKLGLSPSAPSAVLCRRLYLDLIGLPPSPQELAEFEKVGYEATVVTLLKSGRFGEKWARHWLDVARYSDTNGYEKDMQREQWKWRDWVVNALNRDMPYDQFLTEQIAGDLLPGATQDQIIATGFLRNSMINEEGAIVPEQFRMVEMFDRVDCLGKAVLGLSTQCAQCHTHKFDPLTHTEYYGLFAFLNNSYEAQSWVYTPEQLQAITGIKNRIAAAEERLRTARPQWKEEIAAWEQAIAKQQQDLAWESLIAAELGTISGLNHPTQEADKSLLMKGHTCNDVFMISAPALSGITGIRLEALNHRDLPHNGPGRSRLGTWAIQEVEVFVKKPDGKDWEKQKLTVATADFSEPEVKQPDGPKVSGPVAHLIDGKNDTTWNTDRGVGRRNQPSVAVLQFEKPLDFPAGTQFKIAWRQGDMLGCCRWSITRQAAPTAPPVNHAAILAIQTLAAERTSEQQGAIFTAWRASLADAKAVNDEIEAIWKEYPQAATSILHMQEREPANRHRTNRLDRGNWDQPMEVVEPHTPAAFHSFPEGAPRNRLGLARWLTDKRSPLTARVAVNRIWQAMFGAGLVETPEDFGTRAPVPEYRELLDWLAVDFMQHGWSQKHLIRTIVTSATYKQTSYASPELHERDPRNVWLARGPRFRAEAEVLRDIALSISGLMTQKLGGPSIIPPVPQNVLDYNFTYPTYWKPAEGAERYRRTLYVFRKRSMPDPVMANFDGPNGDFACARRMRSNTPLAALTGLNETIFVEAARAFALRILRDGGKTEAERADYAFFLCTSRKASAEERQAILDLLTSRRKRLAEGWLNPREVATGDPAKLPALPGETTPQDAAAWTLAARVLLNLDETISKN